MYSLEYLSAADHRIKISMSTLLTKILGFDVVNLFDGDMTKRLKDHERPLRVHHPLRPYITFVSDRPINTTIAHQNLLVYCNVADYSFVGATAARILRTVPIRGKKHAVVKFRSTFRIMVLYFHQLAFPINMPSVPYVPDLRRYEDVFAAQIRYGPMTRYRGSSLQNGLGLFPQMLKNLFAEVVGYAQPLLGAPAPLARAASDAAKPHLRMQQMMLSKMHGKKFQRLSPRDSLRRKVKAFVKSDVN